MSSSTGAASAFPSQYATWASNSAASPGASNSIIGPRRALLLGASIFIVASAFGGFAVTPAMLIAARVLQGLGAALGLVLGGVLTTSSHRALSTVAHRAYGRCA